MSLPFRGKKTLAWLRIFLEYSSQVVFGKNLVLVEIQDIFGAKFPSVENLATYVEACPVHFLDIDGQICVGWLVDTKFLTNLFTNSTISALFSNLILKAGNVRKILSLCHHGKEETPSNYPRAKHLITLFISTYFFLHIAKPCTAQNWLTTLLKNRHHHVLEMGRRKICCRIERPTQSTAESD